MKRGTPRNPKTKALARALKKPVYAAVGILEMLWHFTQEFCVEGDVGRVPDEEIAEAVGWEGDPQELIEALVSTRWLDDFRKNPEFSRTRFRLMVHDWRDHCDDYTKKKLKDLPRFDKIPENSGKFCPTVPCHAAPSHAEPGPRRAVGEATETDAPLPMPITPPARPPRKPATEFEVWFESIWEAHPNKTDRLPAERAAADHWNRGLIDPAEFARVHAEHCETPKWTDRRGAFAPKLGAWITDRGYLYSPPAEKQAPGKLDGLMKTLMEESQ